MRVLGSIRRTVVVVGIARVNFPIRTHDEIFWGLRRIGIDDGGRNLVAIKGRDVDRFSRAWRLEFATTAGLCTILSTKQRGRKYKEREYPLKHESNIQLCRLQRVSGGQPGVQETEESAK